MRKKFKNIAMVLCSMIMAVALVFGFTTLNAKAEAPAVDPSVSLVNGASLKIDAEDPSLVFTGFVEHYDESATYGVVVVEESILVDNEITEDYLAKLDELGLAYEKIDCTPFGDAHKIKAYFSVEAENFDVDYAAVAFVEKAGAYFYTDLTENNVRSLAYVAQMALRHESFSEADEAILRDWLKGVEGSGNVGGNGSSNGNVENNPENTVVSLNVDKMNAVGDDGTEVVSFITSDMYSGGSVVEFDIYVPIEVKEHFEAQSRRFSECWITVCWSEQIETTDMYAHVDGYGVDVNQQITAGEWSHVRVVLPGESNLYVYISSAKGEWNGNCMLIDNFKITETYDGETYEYVEDFEGDIKLFDINGNPNKVDGEGNPTPILPDDIVKFVNVPANVVLGPEVEEVIEGEYALKYTFNVGMDEKIPFITNDAFPAGSKVEFMYYIPEGTEVGNAWWIWAWTEDPYNAPYYAQVESPAKGADLTKNVGEWTKVTVTLPAENGPYYIYIASSVGGWTLDGDNSYVLIDNFTVNGELVEDFNHGLKKSAFKVRNEVCVGLGDGYEVVDVDGEYSMLLTATSKSGYIPVASKQTFAGGSTITFKYFIPEGTTTSWWRTGYKATTPDYDANVDYYDAPYVYNSQTVGVWETQSLTLPTDAESYYIFFVTEDGSWSATYGDPYILIDNFAVDSVVVEDFNKGLEKSIFEIRTPGVSLGDGFVEAVIEEGEYSMKYIPNALTSSDPAMVTKEAYAGGSEVSFRYFIPEGTILSAGLNSDNNIINTWWGLAYSTANTDLSLYDAASAAKAKVIQASQTVIGAWAEVKFTLPEDGSYYLYFGAEISKDRWVFADGSPAYILIDDFTIGGETEDFNNGLDASIFNVNSAKAIELGDGFVQPAFVPGEHAVEFNFETSFDCVSTTFMTKEAVAKGGDTVTLQYYIPESSTVGGWWFLGWSTTKDGASFWVPNQVKPVNGGLGITTTKGEWVTYTINIPADEEGHTYYLYVCGYENWNGPVYIDNVVITRENEVVAKELFNNEPAEWMFAIGNESYVSYGDGCVYEEPSQEPEYTDLGVKIIGDLISGTASTPTFITKNAYTFTEATTVTFDYYMYGNDKPAWWMIGWTDSQTNASIYAHAAGSGRDLPKDVQGEWATVSVEIPAGTWYLYIGLEKGQWGNQNGEKGKGYVILDNFKVGSLAFEDFNAGIEDSIFVVSPFSSHHSAVEMVEGIAPSEPTPDPDPTPDPEPDPDPTPDPEPDPEPIEPGEYAMKLVFANDLLGMITKEPIAGGTTVSFKYFIAEGTEIGNGWWGVAWHTDAASANNYHAAGIENAMGFMPLTKVVGTWVDVEFTLPADGSYYIYFGSDFGGSTWKLNGENSYALFDEFVFGDVHETFTNGLEESIFTVLNADRVTLSADGEGFVEEVFEPGEYSMKLWAIDQGGVIANASNVAFAGGSEISFKYFIPAGTTTNWWWISYISTVPQAAAWTDYYNAPHFDLPKDILGQWVSHTVTLPTDAASYYIFFVTEEGHWVGPNGETAYVLIDNITVNGELVEDFNNGFEGSTFDARTAGVELGEGFVEEVFEPGEYSMSYICNVSSETVSQVTTEAYAGGSTVSFMYYIPAGTVTSWWGISWSTSNTGLDIYATAGANGYQPGVVTGAWTPASFTLPEGGPYYLYFGAEVGGAHGRWMLNGENATILIDDFTVNGETEDFTGGLEGSMFTVLVDGAVALGDGYVYVAPNYCAKINVDQLSATMGKFSLISNDAYPAGSTISFKYKITGNTNQKWWSVIWFTADNRYSLDLYAHTSGNGVSFDKDAQNVWLEKTVTLPQDGGPYYITVGGALGEWSGGYLYIDDVVITNGDDVLAREDFSNGFGIFYNNLERALTLANEGFVGASEPVASVFMMPRNVFIDMSADLDNLVADGSINDYANSEDRAYFIPALDCNATGLASSSLAVSVKFGYTMGANDSYAIVLDARSLLLVTADGICFYQDGVLVAQFDATGVIDLSITKGGKVFLSTAVDGYAGEYVGTVELGGVKLVGMFIEEAVVIEGLDAEAYQAVPTQG